MTTDNKETKDYRTAFSGELIEREKQSEIKNQGITKEEFLEMLFIDSINSDMMEFFTQTIRNLENVGDERAAYAKALEKQQ